MTRADLISIAGKRKALAIMKRWGGKIERIPVASPRITPAGAKDHAINRALDSGDSYRTAARRLRVATSTAVVASRRSNVRA